MVPGQQKSRICQQYRRPTSIKRLYMRSEKKNPYRATRKEFLQKTALVAAGALFLPAWVRAGAFARFGIAGTFDPSGAPAPSGTLADTAGNAARVRNIGIQLYTVRKEMLADPLATLQQLAKIGFKELESARSDKGNYYGLGPKEIKKICSDLGMRLRSGHVHADKDFQQSIDQAAETGQEYLIASVLPSKGQTIEHYQESA